MSKKFKFDKQSKNPKTLVNKNTESKLTKAKNSNLSLPKLSKTVEKVSKNRYKYYKKKASNNPNSNLSMPTSSSQHSMKRTTSYKIKGKLKIFIYALFYSKQTQVQDVVLI